MQTIVRCYTELEIETENCLDICQHNIKFVLAFTKNDLMLVEICLGNMSDQSGDCTGQHQIKSGQKMSDV